MHSQADLVSPFNKSAWTVRAVLAAMAIEAIKPGTDRVHGSRQLLHPALSAHPRIVRRLGGPVVFSDQLNEFQFRAEIVSYPPQFVFVKALQVNRVPVIRVAETCEHIEHERSNVDTFCAVPGGMLDLRVDTYLSPSLLTQIRDELEFALKGMNSKVFSGRVKSARVDRVAVRVGALMHSQGLDFRKVKIARVEPAIRPGPRRKAPRNIGYAIQMDIVENNKLIIAGGDDVLFEVIGAHCVGKRFASKRMLRKVSGRSSMGDDDGPHTLIYFNKSV